MAQIFTMNSVVLPLSAHVVGFVGREAISEPYCFEIGLEIGGEGFDADGVLRAEAVLEMHVGGGAEPHAIHGIVAAIELLHTYAGKALYRLTLVPKLWHLGRSVHSRVFTDNTIIETIEAVLRHGGLGTGDFRFQLLHDYAKLEHVCQYKESDLAFISRWMQREGLYYFFDHSGDAEQLVITDSLTFHASRTAGALRYVPLSGGDHMALEALDVFMAKHSALPAKVKLTDYDYLRPKLELGSVHEIDEHGLGVVQIFGEHLRDVGESKRYARVRAEEQLAEQRVFQGRGRVFRQRPNYRFQLEEHPITAYNGKSYLVTALEHVGNQSATEPHIQELLGLGPEAKDEYVVRLTAIPADVQYRATRRVSWPRVDGYELAVVCGDSASDYAQLDDHGRYRCRVLFDESDLVDGSATTWVRMMQPHGGGVEGFHFPLRKGTEILLFFLAGDPDRPVIAGVTPNPLKPSPVTSGNHTKNVLQTGGRNRLELEDQAGAQHVTLSTPTASSRLHMGAPVEGYEVVLTTDDNTLIRAGKELALDVGHTGGGSWKGLVATDWITRVEGGNHELWVDSGSSSTTVKGDTSLHVIAGGLSTVVDAGSMTTTVSAGPMTTTVAGSTMTTTVKDDAELHVTAGNYLLDVHAGTGTIHSKGPLTLKTDAGHVVEVGADLSTTVEGDHVEEIKGAAKKNVFGPRYEHEFADNVKITAGVSSTTNIGFSNSNFIGFKVSLEAAGSLSANWGYRHSLNYGLSCSVTSGVALSVKLGVSVTSAAVEVEKKPVKMSSLPLLLRMSALHFQRANVHVLT